MNKCTKCSNTRCTVELIEHKHLKNKRDGFCTCKTICDCLSENPPSSFALASISRNTILKIQLKQVDILISKNQVLKMLYLKHHV